MRTTGKLALWGLVIVLAGMAGAWVSWTLASPGDMQREARSFAILAVSVLVGGTFMICSTGRFWFHHSNRRHRSRTRKH